MFGEPKVTMNDEWGGPTTIAAERDGNIYVALVDYRPGSNLDLRLTAIEDRLDRILDKLAVLGR